MSAEGIPAGVYLKIGSGRETSHSKGLRYLLEGRVNVRLVTPERAECHVKGDSGAAYRVTNDYTGWSCTCPAQGRCAHQWACQRVLVR